MATADSLRQKSRGAQSLPRRQSMHPGAVDGSSQPMPPPPRVRPKDKSKVETLMKRRYSMRVVPGAAAALEAFPPDLSSRARAATGADTSHADKAGPARPFDSSALMSRGFDPEQYIASHLTGASEEELQAFYESLQELRLSTSADLQANVFNNYASFVSLSHEISSLTSDLSSLSTLLLQFSNLTQSLSSSVQKDDSSNSTDSSSTYPRDRRGAQHHRNSIADLAVIHTSHLQELWHYVEGSQKFLPAHPGRHVIKESLNWTELNSATWKPTKTVHLILLNDHLLVAARKRGKTADGTRKSVADRCWNLLDIEINSLKETRLGAADGAIQVTRGRELAVYAPPQGRAAEQTSFIQAFKRANIDLHNKRRQTDGHNSKHAQGASVVIPRSAGHVQGNDVILRRVSMNFGAFGVLDSGTDKSTRWIQDRMDDLDVLIAMRDFEEAVRSLEKGPNPKEVCGGDADQLGRQTLASMDSKEMTYSLLSLHLSHRTKLLTDHISHALDQESHLPNSAKRYVRLLVSLGEEDLARSTYLASRTEYVRRKLRAMQHPGAYGTNDVDGVVEAIAWVMVRIIKNSWTVYSDTFSETRMASSFFEWAKALAEEFSELFRRQLYGYSQDSQLYKHSKIAVQSVWLELKTMGLDLSFILEIKKTEEPGEKNGRNGSRLSAPSAGDVQGLGLQSA